MSPIEAYKQKAKEFNITEEKQVHPRQKLAFVESQAQEQMAIINRLLFDCALASTNWSSAKDDISKAAHAKRLNEFESDLRQLTVTLDFYLKAAKELRSELPKDAEA